MKSARRRSRELATQGLYQWLLSGSPGGEIDAQLRGAQGYDKADHEHLDAILHGVMRDSEELSAAIAPCLDRPIDQLSPVERAVLLVAAFELKNHVDIPYRVVINEAVELTKTFGGSDGYKYVNGVLDKLSAQLRAAETQAARKG
ncbi:N utilization substance protein B [Paraburkholderia atlantica]|uniref:Transcription antitermination protein NusB n=1 Tax=Paraburkholderia atlantica TaxID=2654982 RepID=D5WBK3_PARAM|nr:transcription antitermination factor NusB [Paraburkholderia atlantica]ADG16381.1 NusB antitermination factor [Paraburkholderia atlantica]MBB5420769.1 N utilization substance protein B [Paraburkholderia atlantica]MBB5428249.1 N utilization substance protein B [Paraburkholderia atlantica]MBB5509013.1 N utilization substance protein B [Paraburkholderia atlantica]MPW09386.1 transcription antitermination factor NusB [Paraburkholderia atlantica]